MARASAVESAQAGLQTATKGAVAPESAVSPLPRSIIGNRISHHGRVVGGASALASARRTTYKTAPMRGKIGVLLNLCFCE